MSFKELGIDYTCDLCGKTVHRTESPPPDFTLVEVKTVFGISRTMRLHACEDCWLVVNPETKKTLMQKLKDKLR